MLHLKSHFSFHCTLRTLALKQSQGLWGLQAQPPLKNSLQIHHLDNSDSV